MALFKTQRSRQNLFVRHQVLMFSFVAFLIMVMLTPYLTISASGEAGEGSALRQVFYFAVFGLLIFSVRPLGHPERLLVVPWPIVLAFAWCTITLLWSLDPGVGGRRLILTGIVIWSVFIAVRNQPFDDTIMLIRGVLLLMLVVNFIAVLRFPEFGTHQFNMEDDKQLVGDWRGVMMSKNIAGALCSVTVLFFLFGGGKVPIWLRVPVIAASLVFLFFSQSKTSGIMMAGSALIALLYNVFRWRYRSWVIALLFLAFAGLAAFLSAYHHPLRDALDDPHAFTGRAQIWDAMLRYAADSHYVGAGFGSFWFTSNSPIFNYAHDWVATVTQGHSGYLDLLITVSPIGVVLIAFALIIWPAQQLLRLPVGLSREAALPLGVIFFCAGHNATETSMFDRDTLMNIFMLAAVAMIEQIMATRRERPNLSRGNNRRSAASPQPLSRPDEGSPMPGGALW
ncbi:hypothetical protein SAMIE_1032100 [Sphingobium amiense]|uniref:O-antigen ligase-related domain-containing protein n=1 Tax=Sphingobium amiense TaxID=135719 RepID=A0A494WG71_9SPHN|nr:O-antigen ligase family protein [Sphingobium amiense]BBD99709.1 hypothetical protein SAMIE_1032100 [Sphingobium amiense]